MNDNLSSGSTLRPDGNQSPTDLNLNNQNKNLSSCSTLRPDDNQSVTDLNLSESNKNILLSLFNEFNNELCNKQKAEAISNTLQVIEKMEKFKQEYSTNTEKNVETNKENSELKTKLDKATQEYTANIDKKNEEMKILKQKIVETDKENTELKTKIEVLTRENDELKKNKPGIHTGPASNCNIVGGNYTSDGNKWERKYKLAISQKKEKIKEINEKENVIKEKDEVIKKYEERIEEYEIIKFNYDELIKKVEEVNEKYGRIKSQEEKIIRQDATIMEKIDEYADLQVEMTLLKDVNSRQANIINELTEKLPKTLNST